VVPGFECATLKPDINVMTNDLHDFYVTLLSTASQSLFSSNTHSTFTVEFAQAIHLGTKGRWEVEICEFACPSKSRTS
jgi:hypothetical protein